MPSYAALYRRMQRENETAEQREKRLAYQREYHRRRRENETPEQREERLADQRAANRKHRTRKKMMMTDFKTPDDPKRVYTTSELAIEIKRIFQLRIDELDLNDQDDQKIHADLTDLLSRIELVLNEVGSG